MSPCSALSEAISSATSRSITVVFAQSGSVSVVETTYVRIVLMRSEAGSPLRACRQTRTPRRCAGPGRRRRQQEVGLDLAAALIGRPLDRRPQVRQLDDAVER